jgi:electron transfer flavoprotein beta subunit
VNIIVCVKVVVDPEAPASLFKVDSEAKKVIPPKGTPPVLNPFDENALEAALKLKDSKGATITILSMGKGIPKPVIRKSLATGADSLVLLDDAAFEDPDTYNTAFILTAAIKKMGGYDLILCGREAADTDAGQTGLGVAEMLGIPSISLAGKIETLEKGLRVERVVADGYEVVEIPLPALITVSSEMGNLRTASIAGIMAAQKKPLTTWTAADLGISQPQLKKTGLHQLYQPVRDTKCEMITGTNPEEIAANLAAKLKQDKKLPV